MGGRKRKGDGVQSISQKAERHETRPHTSQGQEAEKKQKHNESQGPVHYTANFQVLASDVDHNAATLLLNIDKFGRICFNAGEGLQRLVRENKVRLQKLENYMFTRVHTETLAGLPGMLLSTSTTGSDAGGLLKGSSVNVCLLAGPSGLGHYCDSFSPYINQEQKLRIMELPSPTAVGGEGEGDPLPARVVSEPLIENPYLTLRAVTIGMASTLKGSHDLGSQTTLGPWSPASDVAACYVCELAGVPGKFDLKKAEAVGVPNGPLRGELQRGKEVRLPSLTPGDLTQRIVRPEEVMSQSSLGPLAIIVDCPSLEYLDSLTGVSAEGSVSRVSAEGGALDRWTQEESGDQLRHRVMFHFRRVCPMMTCCPF